MKRVIYYVSLYLALMFGSMVVGTGVRLLTAREDMMLFLVVSLLAFTFLGCVCAAVAHNTYMTPYELREWRAERAERRSQSR